MIFKRILFTAFLFLNSFYFSWSQKQTNFWYFGTLCGLDFNSGAPVAQTNGVLNTNEGCSAMSDANGNLLFYTNGVAVWDKTHLQMPNGSGLMGDISSTQSGLIVPVPGSANSYYIFTVDYIVGPNGFRYSRVDMSLNGGKGDVTAKNTLLKNNVVEKQAAVYHCNGTDIWVMVHDWGTNAFYAYLVTGAGINPPVVSNVGSVYSGNPVDNSVGEMKFSPSGKKIVSAVGYQNIVEVFDFNINTGVVSNPVQLTFASNHVYGVEFSPDESKLYASYYQIGNAGWLAQFDLNAANVQSTQTLIGTSFDPNYIYGLQLGSDNKIYAAVEITPWLAVINSPNTAGTSCNYVAQGVNVDPNSTGSMCMLGLPEFVASYFNPNFPNLNPTANAGPDVTILAGGSTQLNASGGGTYSWSPSAGLSCTTCANPVASPASTTSYEVIVTSASGCTAMDSVTVFVEPVAPPITCSDPYLPNAFSPNKDGENDSLKLYYDSSCIVTFSIDIYDRWGERVFSTSNPAFMWAGDFLKEIMNTQVFVYRMQATLADKRIIFKKGNISLFR